MDGVSLNLMPRSAHAAVPAGTAPRFRVERLRAGPWIQVGSVTGFEWNRVHVTLDGLPEALSGLRIIHLSDLHLRARWCPAYDLLNDRLRLDPPDLIVITGDFVEHRADHRKALPTVERFVTGLRSRHGVWGILGNHDGDLLGPRLRQWNVHVICGRVARLPLGDAAIELVGVPSVSRRDLCDEFVRSLPPLDPGMPRLVLSHFPDSVLRMRDLQAHLVLAGHTHGGQVCLPGGVPVITHDDLPRLMCQGIHPIGDKLLIVNRGLGFASLPLRLFCPPEVIEIVLSAS